MSSTTSADIPVVRPDPSLPVQPLFSISRTLEEARPLDLKPVYMSLRLEPSAFSRHLGGVEPSMKSPYSGAKSVLDCAVRGSMQYSDRIWLFKGDSYYTYFEKPDGRDLIEGPTPITKDWGAGEWPPILASGIDAVLHGTDRYEGKIWFFKGSQYTRYDLASGRVEHPPKPTFGSWPGIPADFAEGVDAAVHGMGATYYGICWFFKGPNYIRYNLKTDQAEAAPRPIIGNWGKWPSSFDGVDFAFYGTGKDAEKIFFFRGDQYLVYDLKPDCVTEGPAPIIDILPELAQLMPRPQLFLIEKYCLRKFHGEMGRGDPIGVPIQIGPMSKTETYIVTKEDETVTAKSSRNVLESESQEAADSFSDSTRADQSSSKSQEDYDYDLDASFHGDASATSLTGGEANAHLNVRGGSQDTRKAFARDVSQQLGRQASETHDIHKQQARSEDAGYELKRGVESGFKQVIDNSGNPKPINVVLFQITQEYITVLSLVDAEIGFRNGNPRQSRTVRLRDLGTLLDECLADSGARTTMANAVYYAFDNVVDYSGQPRSILTQAQGTVRDTDPEVSSTYEVKDSAGNLLRKIVVPGVIVSVDRVVVLTPNTALAVLETG